METYEEILQRMQMVFLKQSGIVADDASDIGIRMRMLAGEIFSLEHTLEWIKKQAFPQTADKQFLEMHAQQRGLKRKKAVQAVGSMTFFKSSTFSYDLIIPCGTVCATKGESPQTFITIEDAVIKTGQKSIKVSAKAVNGGRNGNAAAGAVCVLTSALGGVDSVVNEEPFSSGCNAESDEELRERLLNSYAEISNGTNSSFYRKYALKKDGIQSVAVDMHPKGNGTVDLYVAGQGTVPGKDCIEQLERELNDLREINVQIKVFPAKCIKVSLGMLIEPEKGVPFQIAQAEALKAVESYFLKLKVGEPVLISQVGRSILETGKIKNYEMTISSQDHIMQPTELAVKGEIALNKAVGT